MVLPANTPGNTPLLARLDELHGTLIGPATKELCERAQEVFKQAEDQRLPASQSRMYTILGSRHPKLGNEG